MEKSSILIIEDEKAIAGVLKLKLESAGFVVDVAEDGKSALEMIDRDGYVILLLDLILPDVDGFKVLEAFRAHDTKTPVVVLTNLAQEEDRNRIDALGVSGYYVKSQTSLNEIVEIVRSLLQKT